MKFPRFIGLILSGVLMSLPVEALDSPFTFTARKKAAEIAYGDEAPHVQALPCTGGRCPPNRLLPLGQDRVWIGYEGLMPIGIVNLKKGGVQRYLDLSRKQTPTGEQLALQLYAGFTRAVGGKV